MATPGLDSPVPVDDVIVVMAGQTAYPCSLRRRVTPPRPPTTEDWSRIQTLEQFWFENRNLLGYSFTLVGRSRMGWYLLISLRRPRQRHQMIRSSRNHDVSPVGSEDTFCFPHAMPRPFRRCQDWPNGRFFSTAIFGSSVNTYTWYLPHGVPFTFSAMLLKVIEHTSITLGPSFAVRQCMVTLREYRHFSQSLASVVVGAWRAERHPSLLRFALVRSSIEARNSKSGPCEPFSVWVHRGECCGNLASGACWRQEGGKSPIVGCRTSRVANPVFSSR